MRMPYSAAVAAPLLLSSFLAASASTDSSRAESPTTQVAVDAKALFAEHCASCHGDLGDGKGTADLDRPARSFLDGGYSYGNTPNAVLRSIKHGIPGTPMPAFATLSDDELKALASYVIDLGPEGTVVEPGMSVLTVGDKPVVVHGMMPALREGGLREPRSVVVGFPNGTSFFYRKQDAALLASFVGDFVDRVDWGNRGGDALRPLGTLSWTADDVASDATALIEDADASKPLSRKLVATTITGAQSVRLDFDLRRPDGTRVGGGNEFVSFLDVDGVPVAMRSMIVAGSKGSFGKQTDEPIETLTAEGQPSLEVRSPSSGVFAIDIEGLDSIRVFVHADKWSDALAKALVATLTKKDKNNAEAEKSR